ncbi:hypothetical protein RA21_04475 [Leisingera sp. ANG-DT]|nr:hypothetical protein RA21_04475 [Leisingera sp. ANG-DT]
MDAQVHFVFNAFTQPLIPRIYARNVLCTIVAEVAIFIVDLIVIDFFILLFKSSLQFIQSCGPKLIEEGNKL